MKMIGGSFGTGTAFFDSFQGELKLSKEGMIFNKTKIIRASDIRSVHMIKHESLKKMGETVTLGATGAMPGGSLGFAIGGPLGAAVGVLLGAGLGAAFGGRKDEIIFGIETRGGEAFLFRGSAKEYGALSNKVTPSASGSSVRKTSGRSKAVAPTRKKPKAKPVELTPLPNREKARPPRNPLPAIDWIREEGNRIGRDYTGAVKQFEKMDALLWQHFDRRLDNFDALSYFLPGIVQPEDYDYKPSEWFLNFHQEQLALSEKRYNVYANRKKEWGGLDYPALAQKCKSEIEDCKIKIQQEKIGLEQEKEANTRRLDLDKKIIEAYKEVHELSEGERIHTHIDGRPCQVYGYHQLNKKDGRQSFLRAYAEFHQFDPENPLAPPAPKLSSPVEMLNNDASIADKLEELGRLKAKGLISEEEFNTLRSDILKRGLAL